MQKGGGRKEGQQGDQDGRGRPGGPNPRTITKQVCISINVKGDLYAKISNQIRHTYRTIQETKIDFIILIS